MIPFASPTGAISEREAVFANVLDVWPVRPACPRCQDPLVYALIETANGGLFITWICDCEDHIPESVKDQIGEARQIEGGGVILVESKVVKGHF